MSNKIDYVNKVKKRKDELFNYKMDLNNNGFKVQINGVDIELPTLEYRQMKEILERYIDIERAIFDGEFKHLNNKINKALENGNNEII